MKKRIKIYNKYQNNNKIEGIVENVSNELMLQSTHFANILTLSDKLFSLFCAIEAEHELELELIAESESLHFIWGLDDECMEFFQTAYMNDTLAVKTYCEQLSDYFVFENETNEIHLFFATESLNVRLALSRTQQLKSYYQKNTVTTNHDKFSDY
ncbi:MAG: hypothetical protein Q8T08_09175 [Ignavibacteria bacterium]|nr:hypothetical protein [Ignavibacteria bacterium]